jgi:hypothetical protein
MMRRAILLCALSACATEQPTEPDVQTLISRIDFGKVTCGSMAFQSFAIRNQGDLATEVIATIDNPDIEIVTPRFELEGQSIIGLQLIARPHAVRDEALLTLTAGEQTLQLPVLIVPEGIHAVIDPPALDFGSVLPNTTKDVTFTVTTDDVSGVPVTLGEPSTPRFEIIGERSAQVSSNATTFTVRLISAAQAQTITGTIPLTSQVGVCMPAELPLVAITVP